MRIADNHTTFFLSMYLLLADLAKVKQGRQSRNNELKLYVNTQTSKTEILRNLRRRKEFQNVTFG